MIINKPQKVTNFTVKFKSLPAGSFSHLASLSALRAGPVSNYLIGPDCRQGFSCWWQYKKTHPTIKPELAQNPRAKRFGTRMTKRFFRWQRTDGFHGFQKANPRLGSPSRSTRQPGAGERPPPKRRRHRISASPMPVMTWPDHVWHVSCIYQVNLKKSPTKTSATKALACSSTQRHPTAQPSPWKFGVDELK